MQAVSVGVGNHEFENGDEVRRAADQDELVPDSVVVANPSKDVERHAQSIQNPATQ